MVGVCAVGVWCAAASAQERVAIDLAGLLAADAHHAATADQRVEQGPRRMFDVFLPLPSDSRLEVDLPADAGHAPRVIVQSERGRQTLRLEQGANGAFGASLAGFDLQPVRLRFKNRDRTRTLTWTKPRVTGVDRALAAPLPRLQLPAGKRLNVVLYVVDTLRADRLSVYGYHRPTTPVMARLAQRGALFPHAYSAGSHTSPSITALFASRPSSDLSGRLAPGGAAGVTLAELFQRAGYETIGFEANFGLIEALGFNRGFADYRVLKAETPEGLRYLNAGEVHTQVFDWLRTRSERPFFLYIQTMDVHFPYTPPEPFMSMFQPPPGPPPDPEAVRKVQEMMTPEGAKALEAFGRASPDKYDGAIAYADQELGKFVDQLAALGLADHTMIIVTADHGEPLLERGEFRHGMSLFEEIVRVPLLVLLPGGQAARPEDIVSLLDVGPTLADAAQIPVPAQFWGRSLFAPRTATRPPAAFGELTAYLTNSRVGAYAREGEWKLIAGAAGVQLYHLPTDPKETRDVGASHRVTRGYLQSAIRTRYPVSAAAAQPLALDANLSEPERKELHDALRALGYIN